MVALLRRAVICGALLPCLVASAFATGGIDSVPPPPPSYPYAARNPPPPAYPPAPVIVRDAPPPLSPAMRAIYAPFYAAGLVLRYGLYYGFVAPVEVFARAFSFGAEGGVGEERDAR